MTAEFWTVNNIQFLGVKIRITELPNFYNYKSLNIAFLRTNTKTFRECQKLLFLGGGPDLGFFRLQSLMVNLEYCDARQLVSHLFGWFA